MTQKFQTYTIHYECGHSETKKVEYTPLSNKQKKPRDVQASMKCKGCR